MSLEQISRVYGVPASAGRMVLVEGYPARIKAAGASGKQLQVLLDGEEAPRWIHPTWRVDYLDGMGVRQ